VCERGTELRERERDGARRDGESARKIIEREMERVVMKRERVRVREITVKDRRSEWPK
jgi:hypothetical protein